MSNKDYYPSENFQKSEEKCKKSSESHSTLKRQHRQNDIQYNNYKFDKNGFQDNNVEANYELDAGDSDDIITIPASQMALGSQHFLNQNQEDLDNHTASYEEDQRDCEYEYEYSKNSQKNQKNTSKDGIKEYDNQEEDYLLDPNYGCNREDYDTNNGTGDFRNEYADEYCQNEGIEFPGSTIPNRIESSTQKLDEKLAKYKTTKPQKSTVNTIGEALTYFKSGDHSESTLKSPHLAITSSNLKTYVLNKSCKIISTLNKSEKDCTFCSPTPPQSDSLLHQISKNLSSKYMTSKDFYNVKIINDIIYNENTHIVSVFKDYLILDDISEFLKRRYASFETKPRLSKIYEFYDKYSKVFPNYVVVPENKYMFKNIERKQRMIDERQKYKSEKERKQKERKEKAQGMNTGDKDYCNFGGFSNLLDSSESMDKLFDTKFIDSVNNIVPGSL